MKKFAAGGNRTVAFNGGAQTGQIPLVLLHGFCEDASLWDGVRPMLDNIPVITIDLPGFGQSSQSEKPGMETYAAAVLAVLDHTGVDRCVLTGHSMGGYTALAFAAMFPERLAGLGLFHSHPFADTPERIENRRRGIAMLESGKKDLYVAQMFPNLFAPAFAAAHPEIVDAMIMRGRQQPAEGIIDALNGMIDRLDHTHTLQSVDCPVLFVLGSEDALIPYEEGLRAALLPDISSIRLLNHIGHMGMLETPELFAAIVSDFYHFATRS